MGLRGEAAKPDMQASEDSQRSGGIHGIEQQARTYVDLGAAFDATGDAIFILDSNHRIAACNRTAREFFRLPSRDIVGKYCWEVVHGTDGPIPGCPCEKSKHTACRETMDLQIDERWIRVTIDPMKDIAGTFAGAVHAVAEITEQKRAAEALRRSEEKFRALVESSVMGIYIIQDAKLVYVNPRLAQILGYAPAEIIDRLGPEDLIHPDDLPSVMKRLGQRLDGLLEDEPISYRAFKKDGSVIDIEVYGVKTEFRGRAAVMGTLLDVTRRKRAEEGLAESEAQFRRLMEQSPVAIQIFSPDGRTQQVNPAWERLWGLDGVGVDEVLGQYNILEDEQAHRLELAPLIQEAFAGKSVALPVREYDAHQTLSSIGVKNPGARSRWIDARLYPLADRTGAITNVVLMEEDVTKRVQAEASLRASESQYASLVEGTTDGIVIIQDGLVSFVNSASPKLLGYAHDDLVGRPFAEYVAPEFRNVVMQRHRDRMEGGEPPPIYEIALLRKDSTQLPVEVNATQIVYKDAPAVLVFLRDISERKRVEKALNERDQEIRAIVESSRDWIWALDLGGRHTFSNPAIAQILGYSPSELVGFSCLHRMHPEDRAMIEAQMPLWIQEERGWQDLVLRWRHKDGTWRWLESNAVPITDAAGKLAGFRGVDRDITERIRAEQDLRTSLESTIQAIAGMIETRDPYTSGHQARVAQLAVAIARQLGLSEEEIEGIRVAAILHDIGKMTVPAEILSKPGDITEAEFALIQQHPAAAHGILKGIVFPWPIADIVLQHHERLNGRGYPQGLAKDAIRLEARIIAVADTVEAMSSHRPYRPALGIDAALDEIRRHKGTRYDAEVVDACVRLIESAEFEFAE